MISGNTGCYWTSGFWLEHTCFSFLSLFANQLFPVLINAVAIRGFRSHCQVLRAPPSLTTVQHLGAAPILSRVQDPVSIVQSHQSLSQQHHSRISLQLCPSCSQGGAHAWAGAAPFLARSGMSPATTFCSAGQVTVLGSHTMSFRKQLSFTAPWHSHGNEESHTP